MTAWTKKKEAEFKRLDRKVLNGRASRKEVERAIDLKRERAAAKDADDWSVYESDKITRGSAPRNEREVASGFRTPSEAMDHANALARANRAKTYMVGPA